jgi:hypothetical protein
MSYLGDTGVMSCYYLGGYPEKWTRLQALCGTPRNPLATLSVATVIAERSSLIVPTIDCLIFIHLSLILSHILFISLKLIKVQMNSFVFVLLS